MNHNTGVKKTYLIYTGAGIGGFSSFCLGQVVLLYLDEAKIPYPPIFSWIGMFIFIVINAYIGSTIGEQLGLYIKDSFARAEFFSQLESSIFEKSSVNQRYAKYKNDSNKESAFLGMLTGAVAAMKVYPLLGVFLGLLIGGYVGFRYFGVMGMIVSAIVGLAIGAFLLGIIGVLFAGFLYGPIIGRLIKNMVANKATK